MKYIIDTHIFLWLLFSPEKIDSQKMEILKNPKNRVFITSINFWEISLKYNLGKLSLEGIEPQELPKATSHMGIDILDISFEEMSSFYRLEKVDKHKDPFDRLIIWYCICNNITLITQDGKLDQYKKLGLKVI